MIDINVIRQNPEWVKEQIASLNDTAPIDEIVAADLRRREILQQVEELRSKRNESSKQIGRWMGSLKKMEADLRAAEAGQDVGQPVEMLRARRCTACRPMSTAPKMRPEKLASRFPPR